MTALPPTPVVSADGSAATTPSAACSSRSARAYPLLRKAPDPATTASPMASSRPGPSCSTAPRKIRLAVGRIRRPAPGGARRARHMLPASPSRALGLVDERFVVPQPLQYFCQDALRFLPLPRHCITHLACSSVVLLVVCTGGSRAACHPPPLLESGPAPALLLRSRPAAARPVHWTSQSTRQCKPPPRAIPWGQGSRTARPEPTSASLLYFLSQSWGFSDTVGHATVSCCRLSIPLSSRVCRSPTSTPRWRPSSHQ